MTPEDVKKNAPHDASGYVDFHGVTYHKEIQGSWYTWEKQWNGSYKWEFTHPSWIHKIKPIE